MSRNREDNIDKLGYALLGSDYNEHNATILADNIYDFSKKEKEEYYEKEDIRILKEFIKRNEIEALKNNKDIQDYLKAEYDNDIVEILKLIPEFIDIKEKNIAFSEIANDFVKGSLDNLVGTVLGENDISYLINEIEEAQGSLDYYSSYRSDLVYIATFADEMREVLEKDIKNRLYCGTYANPLDNPTKFVQEIFCDIVAEKIATPAIYEIEERAKVNLDYEITTEDIDKVKAEIGLKEIEKKSDIEYSI